MHSVWTIWRLKLKVDGQGGRGVKLPACLACLTGQRRSQEKKSN
jgi:hypothetical protein